MNETILVNMGPRETRVVTLERGAVRDIYIERDAGRGIVGNIYLGKVVRVMPGMQAAFVDFGAERTGLLHISDLSGPKQRRGARRDQAIEHQLHDGQKLAVQVIRDPLGSKGARLSAEVSLSSRFLVFLPHSDRLAVSQRVEGAGERARLLLLLQEGLGAEGLAGEGGYILRTAAEGVDLDGLRSDLRFLNRLWAAICRRREGATGPQLLYEELPLHLRVARDLATPDLAQVLTRGRLPLDRALELFADVCGAVEAGHRRGVVHRDLKPGNVMITTDEDVKILDFGLAKALERGADGRVGEDTPPELLTLTL